MTQAYEFSGFQMPDQCWSKLPHELFDHVELFKRPAEMMVILYILRHTWGNNEYDKPKRISMDEFVNGRKRRNGTRIDKGLGMAENSIRTGLRAAEEHGFIVTTVDDSDKGRIEKSYMLRMAAHNDSDSLEGGKSSTPDEQKLDLWDAKVAPRTEKETKEKNEEKKLTNSGADPHTHTHESPAPELPVGEPPEEGRKIRPTASGLRSAIQGDESAGKEIAVTGLDLLIGNCYKPRPSYFNAAQRKQLKIQIERFDSDELYRQYVVDKVNAVKAWCQGKNAPFVKKQEIIKWLLDESSWGIYEQQWRRSSEPEGYHPGAFDDDVYPDP